MDSVFEDGGLISVRGETAEGRLCLIRSQPNETGVFFDCKNTKVEPLFGLSDTIVVVTRGNMVAWKGSPPRWEREGDRLLSKATALHTSC